MGIAPCMCSWRGGGLWAALIGGGALFSFFIKSFDVAHGSKYGHHPSSNPLPPLPPSPLMMKALTVVKLIS